MILVAAEDSKVMSATTQQTSLASAALVAGLVILIMAIIAPFAELYVFHKLVVPDSAAETATNILAHQSLFISAIFAYLLTFIGDVVVAWALYVLLKPVHESLSLLTAWFRLVFAVIALVSLLHLVSVLRLLTTPDYASLFEPRQLNAQVMLLLNQFRYGFHFGIIFFSIHLLSLSFLVFRSGYIPRMMGVLLALTGLGYLINALQPILFPNLNVSFITITFFGELIFMVWLLIRGTRIKKLS